MKLWLRLSLGTLAGILLGLLIPLSGGDSMDVFTDLAHLVINIGRYIVFPLVFFSAALGIYELWIENKLGKTTLHFVLIVPAITLAVVLVGVILAFIFSPDPIPNTPKEAEALVLPSLLELLENIFPANFLSVLVTDGGYLLPVMIASLFIGLAFHYQRAHAEPSIDLFDSFSRILFRISGYIIEFMTIGFAVLGGWRILQLRTSSDGTFLQIALLCIGLTVLVGFIMFPLILYFVGGRKNPLPWLRGLFIPVTAAALSGDNYFALPSMIHEGKLSHLIPRKIGSTAYPLTIMFARAGTAAITAMSFLLILKSQGPLEVPFDQVLWIIGASVLASFLLAGIPASGVLFALALISQWYGQRIEEGYLILLPAMPFLIAAGAVLDVMAASFAVTLVSKINDLEMKATS